MAQLSSHAKRVIIQEDIPESAVTGLAEFIDRYYMSAKRRFIEEGSYKKIESQSEGIFSFSWREEKSIESGRRILSSSLSVALKVSQPIVELIFDDLDPRNHSQLSMCAKTIDEIQNVVWTYLQNAKMSSLYFVIGSSEEVKHTESPEEGSNARRNILRRIFSGNTTNVFLFFLFFSYILFLFVGDYAIFLMIAFQLIYLFFADKIILNLGKVRPTAERPLVAIIGVRSTQETLKFLKSMGRNILSEIREQVGHLVIPSAATPATSLIDVKYSVQQILLRNGLRTSPNDIEVKTRNVYSLVEKAAGKFKQRVPKIVIGNSVVSNASATGISANRSSIMITAGSLEDLTDDELESVVGHELGHVKGHDPVILFGVTSFVYVGAFYVWYPILEFLGLFYYVIAFAAIFAVGKVLETRADTQSAVVLQNAEKVASSLTKIGFRQLFQEKYNPAAKFFDWFRFDPHPPIYFRVARMSNLAGKEKTVKHPFLLSLRDCISGFFSAL